MSDKKGEPMGKDKESPRMFEQRQPETFHKGNPEEASRRQMYERKLELHKTHESQKEEKDHEST